MKRFKLTPSILLFLILVPRQFVISQVVYTDIKDITIKCTKTNCLQSYSLDINKDGTVDFIINAKTFSQKYGSKSPYCTNILNSVYIECFDGNSVAIATNNLPGAFISGDLIDASLTWDNIHRILAYYESGQPIYGCYCCGPFTSAAWTMQDDRYVGLRLIVNNQTYYGWIRLSVSVDSRQSSCKILDYAYEVTPDNSISAGDKGEVVVAKPATPPSSEELPGSRKLSI